jgi:hypothetical protein
MYIYISENVLYMYKIWAAVWYDQRYYICYVYLWYDYVTTWRNHWNFIILLSYRGSYDLLRRDWMTVITGSQLLATVQNCELRAEFSSVQFSSVAGYHMSTNWTELNWTASSVQFSSVRRHVFGLIVTFLCTMFRQSSHCAIAAISVVVHFRCPWKIYI